MPQYYDCLLPAMMIMNKVSETKRKFPIKCFLFKNCFGYGVPSEQYYSNYNRYISKCDNETSFLVQLLYTKTRVKQKFHRHLICAVIGLKEFIKSLHEHNTKNDFSCLLRPHICRKAQSFFSFFFMFSDLHLSVI